MELSYQSIKTANQAREAEEMRTESRRRNLLILIFHHLMEAGYMDAASALEQDTNVALRRFEVCDNIDLDTVLMEYESYYFIKFQRYPKLTKKRPEPVESRHARSCGKKRVPCTGVQPLPRINSSHRPPSRGGVKKTEPKMVVKDASRAVGILLQENGGRSTPPESTEFGLNVSPIIRNGAGEGQMKKDIYVQDPAVRWDDIIGLQAAKRLVKEAVVYPIKYPQLFTGILSPWKGLLLYGPPGTGKTLLAKAVATECNTTFFNISASSIVSKWRGDSEKLVRVLFELARYHAPSTIFLDELESVMSQRGTGGGGEHEGSRRMKTELLVQMDGLARSDDLVFVLAASNLPWELDHAMLRRLEKRILVGLPSGPARQAMVSHWLPPLSCTGGVELRTELAYETLAQAMEGYSGSDIRLVCKEAAMRPVRKIFDALESHQQGSCNMPVIHLETVATEDFLEVIAHTKPSARNLTDKYTAWETEYESV
ncbi:katanin p60 ATPase-containing subunit A-like 2 isoform X4 [Salmo salar]|uniref:Katanin p60 ATPase-containing subunit A-like 2 n=1 Tax=Salmo salar TaxID=8030 RepID=A0ABM3CQ25_SALSA|nr:katanin p60 ATPase-containing subunit A-like 2 isoform X4 [Salmo salar]